MEHFLSLLRLALDRSWTVGSLLAVFCGGLIVGDAHGLSVPTELQKWSAVGLMFGIAVLVVSLASHACRAIKNQIDGWSLQKHLRFTLRALTEEEKEFLRPLILEGVNTKYAR